MTAKADRENDTMIFGNDSSMKMVQDPWKEQRELLDFAYKYYPLDLGE